MSSTVVFHGILADFFGFLSAETWWVSSALNEGRAFRYQPFLTFAERAFVIW